MHAERRVKDWLYPFPDFIGLQSPYKPIKKVEEELKRRIEIDVQSEPDDSMRKDPDDQLRARIVNDLNSDTDDNVRNVLNNIISRGIRKWREPKRVWGREEKFSFLNYAAVLVNIGQHQRDKPDIYVCDADDLHQRLKRSRSVAEAKKRF